MTKLAAAFVLCLSLSSCSWFSSNVKPVLTCTGKVVPLADITRVEQDLSPPPDYIDLAELCATVGWDIGACIVDNAQARKPALKAAAEEFKRQHAVEIRSAQPVSLAKPIQKKESPTGSAPRAPVGRAFAYSSQNVGARESACDVACGSRDSLAPPSGCLCREGNGLRAHWVAAR